MRPKIAIFTHSLEGGGAERVISLLLKHLEADFDIHLVLLVDKIVLPIPAQQHIHVLKGGHTEGVMKFLKIPLLAWRLRRYLRQHNHSLVLSFLSRPNLTACWLKIWGWQGRVAISERTSTLDNYKSDTLQGRLVQYLIKKLYPLADRIISNSKGIQAGLTDVLHIKSQFSILYNPIDLAFIASEKTQNTTFTKKAFTFVCVGNFFHYKNHKLLLAAFAQAAPHDSQLWLIGDGPERTALEAYAKTLGIQDAVIFWGFQAQPARLLSKADCFVLPSNVEGFPNVLLEALACGLPIVATDCPTGPRELLAPDTPFQQRLSSGIEAAAFGLLTPVGAIEDMAEALKTMRNDPDLRENYAQKALKRATDFDLNISISAFKSTLHQTLANDIHSIKK